MDLKRALPLVLCAIGIVLTVAGIYRWLDDGSLTTSARILLAAGLALVLNVIFAWNRMKRAASRKAGFPPEDEFSRKLQNRASHVAFHLSFFLWMAIFLFQDMFDKSETMLGVGILGMAGLYGISLVVIKGRGLGDENPN
jgi:hypothetical protein